MNAKENNQDDSTTEKQID